MSPHSRPARRRSTGFLAAVALVPAAAGVFADPAAAGHAASTPLASAAQPDLDRALGLLKRAEANLQSVDGSIGRRTTPPRGSAAKLAASRLEQARKDLEPAAVALGKVPAGTPGLAEATARFDAAAKTHARLQKILTGGSDVGGTGGGGGEESGTKLGYQQVEQLKAAQFNLREVEGNAKALVGLLEELRAAEDRLGIDHRRVDQGLATVANARRKGGFVADGLDALPPDGQGVAPTRQRLVNAMAAVDTVAQFLTPLDRELKTLINPATYPNFQSDYDRLRSLSVTYGNGSMWQSDRAAAAEAYAQQQAAYDECLRIARSYARLMQQRTDLGARIEGVGNSFLRAHAEFMATAEAQRTALPAEIRAHLAEADGYANDAVREQKPLFFAGGIPQRMEWVADKLALLTAIDPEGAKVVAAETRAMQASITKRADSLREFIIRENRMPKDAYAGADRAAVVAIARSGWAVQQKDAQVLAVRIPSETWRRETKWVWSAGAWTFVDRSKLQVRLMVADHRDPALAIDRPVTVIRDHQAGDSMIGVPLRAFKDVLQPSSYIRREHVKK